MNCVYVYNFGVKWTRKSSATEYISLLSKLTVNFAELFNESSQPLVFVEMCADACCFPSENPLEDQSKMGIEASAAAAKSNDLSNLPLSPRGLRILFPTQHNCHCGAAADAGMHGMEREGRRGNNYPLSQKSQREHC